MNYWLFKSEPNVYSIDDLIREGEGVWDGVRNYQARNNIRAMLPGDLAFFYHSNIGMEVVGIVEITTSAFADPTTDDDRWSAIGVKPVKKFKNTIPLKALKADPFFEDLTLVKHSRLSVMPVTKAHFDAILALSEV